MEKIAVLTYDEINEFLIMKWITPIIDGINFVGDNTIDTFARNVVALKKKYSHPLSTLDEELHKVDGELFGLIDELCGSQVDIEVDLRRISYIFYRKSTCTFHFDDVL